MACALSNKYKLFFTQVTSLFFCIKSMSEFTVNKWPMHKGNVHNLFTCVCVIWIPDSTNISVHNLSSSFHKRTFIHTNKKYISESRLDISKWLPAQQFINHVYPSPQTEYYPLLSNAYKYNKPSDNILCKLSRKPVYFFWHGTFLYTADESADDRHVTKQIHM
jgi:hypothetical protein